MPGRNGAGPLGAGPRTGKGYGYCRLSSNRVYGNDISRPHFEYTGKEERTYASEITGLEKRIDSLESKICAILEKLEQH